MSSPNFSLSEVVPIGSIVNARFRGNFHDATIVGVEKKLKCKVSYMKKNDDYTIVSIDSRQIEGELRMDNQVVCDMDGNKIVAVIKSVVDVSTYKLDFYDGDYGYARRRQLLVKKLSTNNIAATTTHSQRLETHKIPEEVLHENLNRSRDDSLAPLPGKRHTFNSLLSSLDSMDPSESSLIVNVLEMSFNDSKNSTYNTTTIRSRSVSSSNKNSDSNVDLDKPPNYSSSLSNESGTSHPSSQTSGEEAIEDFIGRKIGECVLLQPHNNLSVVDLLEILHIELHSKIIGSPFIKYPSIKDDNVDLYQMLKVVTEMGGSNMVSETKKWKEVAYSLKLQNAVPATFCCLKRFFNRWLQPYVVHSQSNSTKKCCSYVSKIGDYFKTKYNNDQTTGGSSNNNNIVNLTAYKSKTTNSMKKKLYKNEPIDVKPHLNDAGSNKLLVVSSTIKKQSAPTTPIRRIKRSHSFNSSDDFIDRSNGDEYRYNRNRDGDDGVRSDSSFSSINMKSRTPNSEDDEDDDNDFHNSKDHPIKAGTSVLVRYSQSSKLDYYPAKVVSFRSRANFYDYFVHYKGWNSRFDEWVKGKFVELNQDSLHNSSKSPKSDNNISLNNMPPLPPPPSHSKAYPINEPPKHNMQKYSIHNDSVQKDTIQKDSVQKDNSGAVIPKRPKGRPPTKHLQQTANKTKQQPSTNQSDEASSSTKKSSSYPNTENENSTDTTTIPPKETPSKTTTTTPSKSPSTSTRYKNEQESSPNSLLISNIGSGGSHRRTRNSLEDAILNAVLKQSVLESNKLTTATDDDDDVDDDDDDVDNVGGALQSGDNNHALSSNNKTDDPRPLDEIMTSIIGTTGAQSDSDLGQQNKVSVSLQQQQQSIPPPHSLKSTSISTKSTTMSNRGRKMKVNSKKPSSPSSRKTSYNNNTTTSNDSSSNTGNPPSASTTHKNIKCDGIKKLKPNKEKLTTSHDLKAAQKADSNESKRKRTIDTLDSNRVVGGDGVDIKTEDEIFTKMPSLTAATNNKTSKQNQYYPMKQSKTEYHSSSSRKTDNNDNSNKNTTATNNDNIPTAVESSSKHINLTKSTQSFITKVNGVTEYLTNRTKTIESELTSKPSLENIRKIEDFLAETQQAYQKLKQKLRKLERGRKRYLQKN